MGRTNTFGAGNQDVFLVKTNRYGTVQWAKTYGRTDNEHASSVQQTSDGGYILSGEMFFSSGSDYSNAFLIKVDAYGDLQWAKSYGGTWAEGFALVRQTSDGGYIAVGWTWSPELSAGNNDFFVIKTDAFGNV